MQSFTTQKIGEEDQTNHFSVIYTILSLVITKMDSLLLLFFFLGWEDQNGQLVKGNDKELNIMKTKFLKKPTKLVIAKLIPPTLLRSTLPRSCSFHLLRLSSSWILKNSTPKKDIKTHFITEENCSLFLTFNFSRNKPYPSQAVLWECTEDPTVICFSHHLPPPDQLYIEKLHSSVC